MNEKMDRYLAAPAESTWRLPLSLPADTERTVLIADDDIASTHAIGLAFADCGFRVDFAHTGLDAVAIARGRKPGAVILDLSMPLGNGWEAAQAIRPFDREALLVAHSGYTSLQECRRAQRAGFDAYFVKPCSLERLIQLINLRFQRTRGKSESTTPLSHEAPGHPARGSGRE